MEHINFHHATTEAYSAKKSAINSSSFHLSSCERPPVQSLQWPTKNSIRTRPMWLEPWPWKECESSLCPLKNTPCLLRGQQLVASNLGTQKMINEAYTTVAMQLFPGVIDYTFFCFENTKTKTLVFRIKILQYMHSSSKSSIHHRRVPCAPGTFAPSRLLRGRQLRSLLPGVPALVASALGLVFSSVTVCRYPPGHMMHMLTRNEHLLERKLPWQTCKFFMRGGVFYQSSFCICNHG